MYKLYFLPAKIKRSKRSKGAQDAMKQQLSDLKVTFTTFLWLISNTGNIRILKITKKVILMKKVTYEFNFKLYVKIFHFISLLLNYEYNIYCIYSHKCLITLYGMFSHTFFFTFKLLSSKIYKAVVVQLHTWRHLTVNMIRIFSLWGIVQKRIFCFPKELRRAESI